ncbi:MAG TPA: hypothetical protein VMF32_22425 [Xanthobacteraceae bacterium]|nr:hypothetical protein [Xanthobacteraceae bacterium]
MARETCELTAGIFGMLLVDDEGETSITSHGELESWIRSPAIAEIDPIEAALARGFVQIWRYDCRVLVLLCPEKTAPVTLAGAIDTIARLNQDWTIIWPVTPNGRIEWFPGSIPAIRRIGMLLEEAGRPRSRVGH